MNFTFYPIHETSQYSYQHIYNYFEKNYFKSGVVIIQKIVELCYERIQAIYTWRFFTFLIFEQKQILALPPYGCFVS